MSSNSHNNSLSWYYNCVCFVDVELRLRDVKQHAQNHTAGQVQELEFELNLRLTAKSVPVLQSP